MTTTALRFEAFKNRNALFPFGNGKLTFVRDGPPRMVGLAEKAVQRHAPHIPVGKSVGHKVRSAQGIGQQMGQTEPQKGRQLSAAAFFEILGKLTPADIGGVGFEPLHHTGVKGFHAEVLSAS